MTECAWVTGSDNLCPVRDSSNLCSCLTLTTNCTVILKSSNLVFLSFLLVSQMSDQQSSLKAFLFFIFHRNSPDYISFTSDSVVVSTPGGSNPHSFQEGWFSKEEACHWLLDMIPCSSVITSLLCLVSKTEKGLHPVNTTLHTDIWAWETSDEITSTGTRTVYHSSAGIPQSTKLQKPCIISFSKSQSLKEPLVASCGILGFWRTLLKKRRSFITQHWVLQKTDGLLSPTSETDNTLHVN